MCRFPNRITTALITDGSFPPPVLHFLLPLPGKQPLDLLAVPSWYAKLLISLLLLVSYHFKRFPDAGFNVLARMCELAARALARCFPSVVPTYVGWFFLERHT